MVHFNFGSPLPYHDNSGYNVTSNKNYNIVYVPGSFAKKELDVLESRLEFLRLLLSPDTEDSLLLGKEIIQGLGEQLNVKPITGKYTDIYTKQLAEGVYARNLMLTRLVHGPLAYGESLFQDNPDEAVRLERAARAIERQGIAAVTPDNRLQQVARGYYQGVKNLFDRLCPITPGSGNPNVN
jgi:hypothetical protein